MALWPSNAFFIVPKRRVTARVTDDSLRELDRSLRLVAPYLIDQRTQEDRINGKPFRDVTCGKDNFGIRINVAQFYPEELSVNIHGEELVVEGHHEERSDSFGTITRHFIRKYTIPEDVNLETIQSHFSDKGELSISAKKRAIEEPKFRTVPIQVASCETQPKVGQEEQKGEKTEQKKEES